MATNDAQLVNDLNALMRQAAPTARLAEPKDKGELPGAVAVVRPGAPSSSGGGGGGIASPLTEFSASNREYWPQRVITSSDGVFTFLVADLKTWNLTDANSEAVQIKPADPSA